MANITHNFKSCHIEATPEEWDSLREFLHSDEYNFPDYFEHPRNDEKNIPEYIIDLVEMADLLDGNEGIEFKKCLYHIGDLLGIEPKELQEYGSLLIYTV